MDVLLVVPAHTDGKRGAREEYMGVEYLHATLEANGFEAEVINADFYGLTAAQLAKIILNVPKPKIRDFQNFNYPKNLVD